jgi:hypothetical protein
VKDVEEVRIATALHRFADGLSVRDLDVDRLEAEFQRRVQPQRGRAPRPSRWDWTVAACAVLGLVLGAIAIWNDTHREVEPARPSLQLSDLVGLWREHGTEGYLGWLWEVHADGTTGTFSSPQGYLSGLDWPRSRVTVSGDVATEVLDKTTDAGAPCITQSRIELSGFTDMTTTTVRDNCTTVPSVLHFTRISPVPLAAPITSSLFGSTRPAGAISDVDQLVGSWIDADTGRLLVIVPPLRGKDCAYLLDDDGDGMVHPDQRGAVIVRPDGSVQFLPDDGGGSACPNVYSRVTTDLATLQAVVDTAACPGAAPSAVRWIRLN